MEKIKRAFYSTLNWFKLLWFLPSVLGNGKPSVVLLLINKFVELEGPLYKVDSYLGRSISTSSDLFNSLVAYYKESKSDVTLNQIMTVLKEEFIEREKHGRK